MKLSNKILIAFFGFIFLYLTAVFAEIRLKGTPNVIDDTNSIAETADLPAISFLMVSDFKKHIQVMASDRPRLEVRSFSGDWLKRLKYSVSGDTLTLSGFHFEDASIKVTVFVPATGLKGISVNTASATVMGLQQDLLHVSENDARIWMADNKIARMHLELSNQSFLDVTGPKIDTVSATIEASEVSISSPVGLFQGSMKNAAFMRLTNIQEIQLKKDDSSRLNMFQ